MTLHALMTNRHLCRALALWACLAVAVCVKTAWHGNHHSVFPQFAASSHHWWADRSLYDDYKMTEDIDDGYRYSPTFAVAFTPLAYMPASLGAMIWNVSGIIMLVCALLVLVRDILPGDWPPQREGTFLGLALVGSLVGIWSGQSNAVVTALVIFAMAAIIRQRWWAASILLAVPVFVKVWPIAMVMLLVVFWPKQLTWRLAVVSAVLALLPFLTRPPSKVIWQYQLWYESLTGPLQDRWPGYRDAWTIWEQLCPPVNDYVYKALQLAGGLAVLWWCWRRYQQLSDASGGKDILLCTGGQGEHESLVVRRDLRVGSGATAGLPSSAGSTVGQANRGTPLARVAKKRGTCRLLLSIFAMWAAWQLFLGPGTEQLTYGIIAPSAAWAVMASFAERRARWLTVTAWAMLALLPSGDIENAVLKVFPAGTILLPLAVLLFVAWLVWHERGGTSPS